MSRRASILSISAFLALQLLLPGREAVGQRTVKPVLHGKHWVAVTGKPLAATAGALIFAKGGNAVELRTSRAHAYLGLAW